MPSGQKTIPIDTYVLDVLLRDLVGHDKQPAAFLVYLHLYGRAARQAWRPVTASLRNIAEATGLSKSAVQTAVQALQERELIKTTRTGATGTPRHRVQRHWATTYKTG
jgi:DNA-binding MarR family transcriptional regulator